MTNGVVDSDELSERLEKILVHLRDWSDGHLQGLAAAPSMSRKERRARGIRDKRDGLQVWANCALIILEERRKFKLSPVPTQRGERARG